MDREDSNGEYAAENAGPGPDRVAANHEMSSRMKQLLFGVRLSAGSAALEPASDLEDLARRLDMARAQRATRNGSSYD